MFKEILFDLMAEKGINQRQLGLAAGIPATTISGWINANRMPDYYALIKLSQFFGVSADYLLGLVDEEGKATEGATSSLPLDETELLKNYRSLSYVGKARVAAYADLMREQEEGSTGAARKKA